MAPLRWGIASAGKISSDFVNAVSTLPPADHKVVAVAARALKSAEEFAKKFSLPRYYEGYEALAKDSEIDIVYIGTLNPQHFEVSKLMLENGKHVLCEKPFTMNAKQTRALVGIAKQKKLFLMEAIWSRCFPAYQELQNQIESGAIGKILYVEVSFGFPLEHIHRVNAKELGGGTILDLGIYVLQFQQFVYRGLKPTKIVALGHLNKSETDESVSAIFTYSEGRTAVVSTSARLQMPNEATVVGTKGTIRVPEFWCPTKLITPTKTFEYELPTTKIPFNFHNSVGLAFEAEEARQNIIAGKLDSAKVPLEETIVLAGYMDTLRKQVGVVYPQDSE